MPFNIEYSIDFINKIKLVSDEELHLIGNFIASFKEAGFEVLPGRNKPSTGVSKNYIGRVQLIQYALKNKLWHYHVGFQFYNKKKVYGDWTSEYVVHYQKISSKSIRLVAYDSHPPFRMPKHETLI